MIPVRYFVQRGLLTNVCSQDQYDKISEHTEAGLEFTKKCADMVRDRIKIEMDYAKSLRYFGIFT